MSSSRAATIDHIIVLLPYKDIVTPPTWLTDHFIISPGGRHADHRTENRLITLKDGSYIELIAFIDDDPACRSGHWWDKPYGIVDFALTSAGRFDPAVRDRLERAGTGVTYAAPQTGGRTGSDGVYMEWEVTFPQGLDRGIIPFWCHDSTPRGRRVPEPVQMHPSGVLGISAVTVKLPGAQIKQVDNALAAIVDADSTARHQVAAPVAVPGTRNPYLEVSNAEQGQEHQIELSLQIPEKSSRQSIVQKLGNSTVRISFSPA